MGQWTPLEPSKSSTTQLSTSTADSSGFTNKAGAISLAIAVEFVGLGIVVMVAGTSEGVGTAIIVAIIGLWLVYLINHASVLSSIDNLVNRVQQAVNG